MTETFDLLDAMETFKFVFRLYNFVSPAREDNRTLQNPFDNITKLDKEILLKELQSLNGKRKMRDDDDDGAGHGSPKKRQNDGGGAGGGSSAMQQNDGGGADNGSSTMQQTDDELAENDILSDVAVQKALRAGYTIPDEVEGFGSILPVRVSFP